VIDALNVSDAAKLRNMSDESQARSMGLISHIQTKPDRKGKTMAFLTVEDFLGSYEILVFSSIYETLREKLQTDAILAFEGKVSQPADEGDPKMLLEKALTLEEALEAWPRAIHLHLSEDCGQDALQPVQDELARHTGSREVYFHLPSEKGEVTIRARGLRFQPGPWLRDFVVDNEALMRCRLELSAIAPAAKGWRRKPSEGQAKTSQP
jgi:DNA polymerase-3 subunit alpha